MHYIFIFIYNVYIYIDWVPIYIDALMHIVKEIIYIVEITWQNMFCLHSPGRQYWTGYFVSFGAHPTWQIGIRHGWVWPCCFFRHREWNGFQNFFNCEPRCWLACTDAREALRGDGTWRHRLFGPWHCSWGGQVGWSEKGVVHILTVVVVGRFLLRSPFITDVFQPTNTPTCLQILGDWGQATAKALHLTKQIGGSASEAVLKGTTALLGNGKDITSSILSPPKIEGPGLPCSQVTFQKAACLTFQAWWCRSPGLLGILVGPTGKKNPIVQSIVVAKNMDELIDEKVFRDVQRHSSELKIWGVILGGCPSIKEDEELGKNLLSQVQKAHEHAFVALWVPWPHQSCMLHFSFFISKTKLIFGFGISGPNRVAEFNPYSNCHHSIAGGPWKSWCWFCDGLGRANLWWRWEDSGC